MAMKKLGRMMMATLLCVSLTACGGGTDSNSSADNAAENTPADAPADSSEGEQGSGTEPGDKLLVGFSAGYSMVQHWELEMNGCQAAADEQGVEFIYKFADGDEAQQVADIENMVEMGIDMLIVGPCNSEGIVPTVDELQNTKNIPVMTSDIGISGTEVTSHVASDNYQIGVMAAEFVGKELDGKGKIAIVGWAAASATKDREDGFVDTIEKEYPDIEIVANQDVGGSRTTSLETSENLIQSNGEIELFFGCNAECALGAYSATQSVNRPDIKVVSVDSDNEVMEAIQAETNLVATVAQNPYEMGYQAMSNAVKYLNGETVENIAIDAEVVTKDNIQDIIDRDQELLK